jgi:hypothetical protein
MWPTDVAGAPADARRDRVGEVRAMQAIGDGTADGGNQGQQATGGRGMSKKTWRTEIELPSIAAFSDDNPWVTLRGSESSDRDEAIAFYKQALKDHDFPLRFVVNVNLQDESDVDDLFDLDLP